MDNENTGIPVKRRVGRPRMIVDVNEQIKRNGIAPEPKFQQNIIELTYDMPLVFKKIFNLFKLMSVKEVKMEFLSNVIKITAIDHLEKNYIYLKINANKLSHYYCKYNHIIVIDLKNIDKVLRKLDKSYNSMTIISKEDSFRKNIFIVFANDKLGMKEFHTINLIEAISKDIDTVFTSLNYEVYPLKFTLPSKLFKKIINDISTFSNIFTIERVEDTPLRFPYKSEAKTVITNQVFDDEDKINLRSTLDKNDIFSVSVNLHYIKALSSSLISDNIDFYVDKEKKIVFKSNVDNETFELIICCEIISYK